MSYPGAGHTEQAEQAEHTEQAEQILSCIHRQQLFRRISFVRYSTKTSNHSIPAPLDMAMYEDHSPKCQKHC